MTQVLISTKYQVVIPKEVRQHFQLKPGSKLTCIAKGNIIYLVPERPLEELRGILKSKVSWKTDLREKQDRIS